MIELSKHGWALLGFTFWCIAMLTGSLVASFLFGSCFYFAMRNGKKDN